MTVRLIIEHATHPQRETTRTWEGGELVIGRGGDAGWQLDDPEQFLSRRHAIVSDIGGVPHVTDASRGGVFVDGASAPLGPGNARALEDGMRLRLGDFVLRVEMQAETGRSSAPPVRAPSLSFEFGPAEAPAAPAQRPADLPNPFGAAPSGAFTPAPDRAPRAPRPLDMEDPFALDLRGKPATDAARGGSPQSGASQGGPFGDAAPSSGSRASSPFDAPSSGSSHVPPTADPPVAPPRPAPASSPFAEPEPPAAPVGPRGSYFFDDAQSKSPARTDPSVPTARPDDPFALGAGFRPAAPVVEPAGTDDAGDDSRAWVRVSPQSAPPVQAQPPLAAPEQPPPQQVPTEPPLRDAPRPEPVQPEPVQPVLARQQTAHPEQAVPQASGPDLYAAFLRGAGLPPETSPADAERAMEDAGRNFRAMVDGLMHLLRARALEKQKVRVAVTVMASANVNPLKTLPTAEDGVAALVRPRGPGYLAPDKAIDGAFRDLADHQVRTWTALQQALRRMIDRFDPAEIEAEMVAAGRMKALLAGGRKSLLWQLYEERYREIAEAAEERFLGEVGADFRDAYEGQRREKE
jgi:type VI secretion system protein ImpI